MRATLTDIILRDSKTRSLSLLVNLYLCDKKSSCKKAMLHYDKH